MTQHASGSVTLSAVGDVSANQLEGTPLQFLQFPAKLSVGATASASDDIFMTLIVGEETIVDDQQISDADRFPIAPDDFVFSGAGLAGDRCILRFRAGTTTATAQWVVKATPAPVTKL